MDKGKSVITQHERWRRLRREQEDVAHTHYLPRLADLEMVRRALPLASIAPVPSRDRDDGIQDRGAVMQQRSDSYYLLRHGSLLEHDLASKYSNLDGGFDTGAELADSVSDFWTDCADAREHFREALKYIVQDKKDAQRRLASYLSSAAQEILVVPKLSWPESDAVELTYVPLSDKGILGYVLMVLLGNNDISERLRMCRYRLCGDFFITDGSARGGPRFNYCDAAHRRLARLEQNAEAQQRYRLERKEKKEKTKTRQKREDTKR